MGQPGMRWFHVVCRFQGFTGTSEHLTKVTMDELSTRPQKFCDQLKDRGVAIVQCNLQRKGGWISLATFVIGERLRMFQSSKPSLFQVWILHFFSRILFLLVAFWVQATSCFGLA